MAIRFECCNCVTTVKEINEKYPGGYETFKQRFPLGIRHWTDGILVRFGDDSCISNWLNDPVGYGVKCYNFQSKPPQGWKMYPSEFVIGCTPLLMWTNKRPDEPEKIEKGWFLQGGWLYKSYYIWQKSNRWLVNWDNPNCFLYHYHKGEICSAW